MKDTQQPQLYEKPILIELGDILTLTEGSEDYNGDASGVGQQYNGDTPIN